MDYMFTHHSGISPSLACQVECLESIPGPRTAVRTSGAGCGQKCVAAIANYSQCWRFNITHAIATSRVG